MMALRAGLAAALALAAQGCATDARWTRRHVLPPPAQESRAGALSKSTGPGSGSAERDDRAPQPSRPLATPTPTPTSNPTSTSSVSAAIAAASSLVGHRSVVVDGVDYGPGCAAVVRAAFARAGRPLPGEVRDAAAVHALAVAEGAVAARRTPAPGDLVFLADRPGGPAAHVGLVERVEQDGTAVVVHRVARGVQRLRVNLAYPSRPTDPGTGKGINDALRVGGRAEPAGKLVVGVSDLLRRPRG